MTTKTPKIDDYAFIGDCHTGALVSREGSVDWLCWPRFDSASLFSALLGGEDHGRWKISPAPGTFRVKRNYRGESMILETIFETDTGSCRLTDAMIRESPEPDLVRVVEGITGTVELELELIIRFEYGSVVPWVQRTGEKSFQAVAGPDAVEFSSPVPFKSHDLRTRAKFTVKAGERLPFVLTWHPSHLPFQDGTRDICKSLEKSVKEWKTWSARCKIQGPGRDCIVRSLLTLKALIYEPTGGMIAALTTSLPEAIGGERNWDYRYCWIRDATFTLYSMLLGGYREEAQAWVDWLVRAVAGTPSQINIMYGIGGERRLPELTLDWLPGYRDSAPVRVGNAAHQQVQLDIFGELMDTAWLGSKNGIDFSANSWKVLSKMLEHLEKIWREPDCGIWEVRGPKKNFTHSKVMAWVAFDRAIKIAEQGKRPGPVARWKEIRDAIHDEVCKQGYDEKLGSFTQSYGEKNLDASLLRIPLVGFLPATDPRVVSTVAAIEKSLLKKGFVLRYKTDETEDGLRGQEGVFLACSFWLVDTYVLQGRHDEAKALFDKLLSLRNDLGLLSEEYDPDSGRMLGNFPQAFSMISLVNSAFHFYTEDSSVLDRSKECSQECSGNG